MFNQNQLSIYIDGKEVAWSDVIDWEFQRLVASHSYLKQAFSYPFSADVANWIADKDTDKLRKAITEAKLSIGFDRLRDGMAPKTKLGNAVSLLAAKLSAGKRKISTTEILVTGTSLTPDQAMEAIKHTMMVKTAEHDTINVQSNPDHYVLQGLSAVRQEVIEVTGGSPLPTRFFAHYYDETGLQSQKSSDYTVQLPGVARLAYGQIIGGMRHQIKAEPNGLRFKALVEFPALVPDSMIEAHQKHLACEFGHWLSYVLEKE